MRYLHIFCSDGTVVCIPNDTRVSGYLEKGILRWDSATARYVSQHEGWMVNSLAEAFLIKRAA